MRRTILEYMCLSVVGGVLVATAPQSASAQALCSKKPAVERDRDPLQGACFGRSIKSVYIPIEGGEFDIKVAPATVAIATFPEWVDFDFGAFAHDGFKIDPQGNMVTVAPDGATVGTQSNFVLMDGPFSVNMNMTMSAKEHTGVLWVRPVPREEYERRKREARNAANDPESRRERLRETADFVLGLQRIHGRHGQISLNRGGRDQQLTPGIARPGELRAALDWAVQLDGYYYAVVTLHNRLGHRVDVTGAAVARRGETEGVPAVIAWDRSAVVRDEALRLDDKQSARAVVEIPGGLEGALDSVDVHLLGKGGITVASTEIIELYPIPDDVRRRRRMARQITVSVRGLFGGFWTGDAAGQDRIDGTTMAGVGVRVQKGYEWGAGFEGELVMARTGEARFEDMSWDDMVGNITRQATLGRGMGGFAMRVGHDLVLTGRLGVGVQVASYDSTFAATDGSVIDGPGDGVEVDGLWMTGASLDARLGEHWSIGAAMNFVVTFPRGSTSLEGGIHLGYGINTKRSPY